MKGLTPLEDEFDDVPLEARLQQRVKTTAARLARAPQDGFPQAMGTKAAIEGCYRLLRNERVEHGLLLEGHVNRCVERAGAGATVLSLEDTTEFCFSSPVGSREGLGHLRGSKSSTGFLAHLALVVEADTTTPLGVAHTFCWSRTNPPRGNRHVSGGELAQIEDRESVRWVNCALDVDARFEGRCSVIHVMDREGDSFSLFEQLFARGSRFVIRLARDRVVGAHEDELLKLSEFLVDMPLVDEREVTLSRRVAKPTPRSTHPKRDRRTARLQVSAGRVHLRRPRYLPEAPETLALNVVYVQEIDAPANAEPISWVLITTEPVTTQAQVSAVISHYRARWLIEELFKAIKTGCSFERRQLESFRTLSNALALCIPIAWQLLLLRSLSRSAPKRPASDALSATEILILQRDQRERMPNRRPTVRDAYYAVAGLGGHLSSNGPPGWQTLGRGMNELVKAARNWDAGMAFAAKKGSKMAK